MKLLLTETQLSVLISHIEESEGKNKTVIEEGWKDVVLGTAMLMGVGLSGVNAQTAHNALDNAETLQKIENTLEGENINKLVTTLEKAGLTDALGKIQNNAQTIEANFELAAKKKNLNLSLKVYNTKSKQSVKNKVTQGYAVSDIEITNDTVWLPTDKVEVSNSVELVFDINIFKTASFDLNDSVKSNIQETIKSIISMGGKVSNVEIISSTDTEPIKMGNAKLAQLRATSIETLIDGMGVSTQININTLPEQGPDVYSRDMSPEEREQAREATSEYRFVKVIITSVVKIQPSEPTKAFKVIERVEYELVKTQLYGKTVKLGKGKVNKTKKFSCLKINLNAKVYSCPKNFSK